MKPAVTELASPARVCRFTWGIFPWLATTQPAIE
jgi:hypothetical protein